MRFRECFLCKGSKLARSAINGSAVLFFGMMQLAGCSFRTGIAPDEAFQTDPTLAARTSIQQKLINLPPPQNTVDISVYEFNDQTGQFKPGEQVQYSRAVTQGGLAILIRALLDAGSGSWFRPLERGGLKNLMQERQIINSMRKNYSSGKGGHLSPVGPLLYSGLLLEGGVISYESNVMTGGLGAKYLGIGGSTRYSRDMVTVSLRAINVTNGEVMLAVSASKTIYSQKLSAGIFKYVSYTDLVEGESGYSVNEPPQLAVRQAIELSVYALIMEGCRKGIWRFQDKASQQRELKDYINRYHLNYNGNQWSTESAIKHPQKFDNGKVQEARARLAGGEKDSPSAENDAKLRPREGQSHSNSVTLARDDNVKPTENREKPRQGSGNNINQSASTESTDGKDPPRTLNLPLYTENDLDQGWYVKILTIPLLSRDELDIAKRLRKAGIETKVQMIMIGGRKYYRMLVGGFLTHDQVMQKREQIMRMSSDIGIPPQPGFYEVIKIAYSSNGNHLIPAINVQ